VFSDAQSASPTLYKTVLLTQILSFVVSKWADLETHMTSVERVLEHADIKQESGQGIVLKTWSKVGEIKFENVELWYSNLNEAVLKSVSFVVRPREKIGVVGRTGAGKSSLVSALFRLCDFEGKVFVNGVDIKTLSLEFLRASISVVPQDSVLFSGTIRENVDPFKAHSDTEICKVLDSVNLHRFIYDLDKKICDADSPFSAGQKQLLCLARVILAKNDIVVVDAAQRLDKKTDDLMNDTVWGMFADRTVLIVSQSPQTLLRCDKVLVLDNGQITELDTPEKLLKNKNGEFHKMVAAANLQA
jgi:ATP-binding cassette subfamily C (CFTR/MRP) protein 4